MKRKTKHVKSPSIPQQVRQRTAIYLREIATLIDEGRFEVLKAQILETAPTTISHTSLDCPRDAFPPGNLKVELELGWIQEGA